MKTATQIKLESVTELVRDYANSRYALVKFISQQLGDKVDVDDPLSEIASQYLDVLYKEFGRESFWIKEKVKD